MSGIMGDKQIADVLRRLPRAVGQDVMTRSLRAGANIVKKEAIAMAPMRDSVPLNDKNYLIKKILYGHLRDNIRTTAKKHRGGAVEMHVHTGRAFWGHFLEFGTMHHDAQPWFSVAWENSKERAWRKVAERMAINLARAAAMLAGPRAKMTKAFRRRL